jgi:hypothetical protein
LTDNNVSGIAKDHLIHIFNSTYFNREYYDSHGLTPMHLEYEDNREPDRVIFKEVCEFVYFNDTFRQMGLSFSDIYNNFDYGTFILLKEFITKQNEKKVKKMNDMQAQMDHRQEQILKGTKND